jgi:hypothetical protein
MLDSHSCDAPDVESWARRPDTIVQTDCTPSINFLKGNYSRVRSYVRDVLNSGPVHFVYYGAQDLTWDSAALNGIRDGMLDAGVPGVADVVASRNPFVTIGQADYDGDGKTDVAVWRRGTAQWFIRRSSDGGVETWGFGAPILGDIPVPADYSGTSRADLAVYRDGTGTWYIHDWAATHTIPWGSPALGDIPVPADYDGDGKANIAVYRRSTNQWWVRRPDGSCLVPCPLVFGSSAHGDVPVPADYDGDGRADVAVYRRTTAQWFILRSSDGAPVEVLWGSAFLAHGDLPVPAKYTTTAKADIAVFRQETGEWFIRRATDGGLTHIAFGTRSTKYLNATGLRGDVPVPGSYTGGLASVAVFRRDSAEWFIPGLPTLTLPVGPYAFNADVPVP